MTVTLMKPDLAMCTDRYELTMVDAAFADGVASRRAVFELFARRLPAGRRYGVVAGTARALDAIERFRFADDDLAYLEREAVVSRATLDWLADHRFRGSVHGVREGEVYGPGTPVLTVEGTFAEAVLLETVLLSTFNHDTAVAGAAARMVHAAAGRGLVEMGGRRTHEAAAVDAARAAWIAGFDATSNLEAGRRYGVPTRGTAAHAFTLAHVGPQGEQDAFIAQLRTQGLGTTLLVDTYDTATGIERAVAAARLVGGAGPGAIRIDSGDLRVEAERARRALDALGAEQTRIVVTGDLDEQAIDALVRAGAPVDSFGVGTSVVTGSGHPTADFIYKLVAIEASDGALTPVAKASVAKATVGGRKRVWRALDAHGHLAGDRFVVDHRPIPDWARPGDHENGRALQVPLLVDGEVVHAPTLDEVRAHHRRAMAELPPKALDLADGPPAVELAELTGVTEERGPTGRGTEAADRDRTDRAAPEREGAPR